MTTQTASVASSYSNNDAIRLTAATLQKTSNRAKHTARALRQADDLEQQARADGYLDADGFFTQSDEDFHADLGLAAGDLED